MKEYNCTSVHDYEKLEKLGQGTYGIVYRARHKRSGRIVAMKKLFNSVASTGGFMPTTSLREIHLLKGLNKHENLIELLDVAVGKKQENVFLVFEYCKHDFSQLLHQMTHSFSLGQIKRIMIQLLRAVAALHSSFVIHRDLKLSNLLMDEQGLLKLSDLGLAREFGRPLTVPMTPNVVSLWYRAPELLLSAKIYTPAIDLWAVGCIFAELLNRIPLFRASSELAQLDMVCKVLGKPSEREWSMMNELEGIGVLGGIEAYQGMDLSEEFPQLSDQGMDLLLSFLQFDPKRRLSAQEALRHPFFQEEPLPIPPEEMKVFIQDSSTPRKRKKGY